MDRRCCKYTDGAIPLGVNNTLPASLLWGWCRVRHVCKDRIWRGNVAKRRKCTNSTRSSARYEMKHRKRMDHIVVNPLKIIDLRVWSGRVTSRWISEVRSRARPPLRRTSNFRASATTSNAIQVRRHVHNVDAHSAAHGTNTGAGAAPPMPLPPTSLVSRSPPLRRFDSATLLGHHRSPP
jgi:hypothetical protein